MRTDIAQWNPNLLIRRLENKGRDLRDLRRAGRLRRATSCWIGTFFLFDFRRFIGTPPLPTLHTRLAPQVKPFWALAGRHSAPRARMLTRFTASFLRCRRDGAVAGHLLSDMTKMKMEDGGIQGSAKRWALGCVNSAFWLPLAAGGEFTQPRATF